MKLEVREYDAIRLHGDRFAVLPGHDLPTIERVVEETPSYCLGSPMSGVETEGEAPRPSCLASPRSRFWRETLGRGLAPGLAPGLAQSGRCRL